MTYKKGSFLALRSDEGGFYLCKTLESIPHSSKTSKKYRIKWLEAVSLNKYKLSYDDSIVAQCIIDQVILVNRKSTLILASSELKRIEKLLQDHNSSKPVEELWSDNEGSENSESNDDGEEKLIAQEKEKDFQLFDKNEFIAKECVVNSQEKCTGQENEIDFEDFTVNEASDRKCDVNPGEESLSDNEDSENSGNSDDRQEKSIGQENEVHFEGFINNKDSHRKCALNPVEELWSGNKGKDIGNNNSYESGGGKLASLENKMDPQSFTVNKVRENEYANKKLEFSKSSQPSLEKIITAKEKSVTISDLVETSDNMLVIKELKSSQPSLEKIITAKEKSVTISDLVETSDNMLVIKELKSSQPSLEKIITAKEKSVTISDLVETSDNMLVIKELKSSQPSLEKIITAKEKSVTISDLVESDNMLVIEKESNYNNETGEGSAADVAGMLNQEYVEAFNDNGMSEEEILYTPVDLSKKPKSLKILSSAVNVTTSNNTLDKVLVSNNKENHVILKCFGECPTSKRVMRSIENVVDKESSTESFCNHNEKGVTLKPLDLSIRQIPLLGNTNFSDENITPIQSEEYSTNAKFECGSKIEANHHPCSTHQFSFENVGKNVIIKTHAELPAKDKEECTINEMVVVVGNAELVDNSLHLVDKSILQTIRPIENYCVNDLPNKDKASEKGKNTSEHDHVNDSADEDKTRERQNITENEHVNDSADEDKSSEREGQNITENYHVNDSADEDKTSEREEQNITENEHVNDSADEDETSEGEEQNITQGKEEGIVIPVAMSKKKKSYDQKHCCYYCDKYVNKMSRHLTKNHNDETEVARVLSLPNKSRERREAFAELTRIGDYYKNMDTLALKKGELLLLRRPSVAEAKKFKFTDYGPCPNCLGFMLREHLWHHAKYKCPKQKLTEENEETKRRDIKGESLALLSHVIFKDVTEDFTNEVLNKLCDNKFNKIKETILNDNLILSLGKQAHEKYGSSKSDLTRQMMRRMARLLISVRSLEPNIQSLKDCVKPSNFDTIIQAVRTLCALKMSRYARPTLGVPSLALKIGHGLRKCAQTEIGRCIRMGDLKGVKETESFITLMNIEWGDKISSAALASMNERKLNSCNLLPLTSDLMKLNKYLDKSINELSNDLVQNCNARNWRALSESLLCRIIIFNKRRSGETSRMKISNFLTRPDWMKENTQELTSSLTPIEKKLSNDLTLIYVVGKRQRNVPVLLTKQMREGLDLLLKTRSLIDEVKKENPFIFAAFNSDSHIRGHDCLKKFCMLSKLEAPDLITGTKLRKYVATVTQVFNMNENEYDWLARHLGHDVRVHRDFYRLHESAVELTKVSRLLIAVDEGKVSQFAGKTLAQINVSDLPPLVEDDFSEHEQQQEDNSSSESENDINECLHDVETVQQTSKGLKQMNSRKQEQYSEKISPSRKKLIRNKGRKCKKNDQYSLYSTSESEDEPGAKQVLGEKNTLPRKKFKHSKENKGRDNDDYEFSSSELESDSSEEDSRIPKKKTSGSKRKISKVGSVSEVPPAKKCKNNSGSKSTERRNWTVQQKEKIYHSFRRAIKNLQIPGKEEIERFLAANSDSQQYNSFNWKDIKYCVYNRIQTMKKSLNQYKGKIPDLKDL